MPQQQKNLPEANKDQSKRLLDKLSNINYIIINYMVTCAIKYQEIPINHALLSKLSILQLN